MLNNYYIQLMILTLGCGSAGFFVIKHEMQEALPYFYGFLIYFFVLTAGLHAYLAKVLTKNSKRFTTAFMSCLSIKLFLSVFLLLVLIYTNKEMRFSIAIPFIILYFVFTAFEVIKLRKKVLKKQ